MKTPRRPNLISSALDRQLDRAAGVLVGAACGDALGVPYEFGPPLSNRTIPEMRGGGLGPYAPAEWSDDTQMSICIAEVAATGADLRAPAALDNIARRFLDLYRNGATDVGAQTRTVLTATDRSRTTGTASTMCAHANALHARTGRTAGNGSLMRTSAVGLAYLTSPTAAADTARRVSQLTHPDPLAGDACVLWTAGIRHAVMYGTFEGVRGGLSLIPASRRTDWGHWLDQAEANPPHHFRPNGYVVTALQAAWSAITRTAIPTTDPAAGSFACQHLEYALQTAVRIGHDTDTVAAIAGALLGARWGISAIPLAWQRRIHGWPGLTSHDLTHLALQIAYSKSPAQTRTPRIPVLAREQLVMHPHDGAVLLGSLRHIGQQLPDVDAVVSLCRAMPVKALPPRDHVRVRLIDTPGHNEHPHYLIDQAARSVAELRAEGRRVLLHCAAGRSRTSAVAARYSQLLGHDVGDAFMTIDHALGRGLINSELRTAVYELAGWRWPPPRTS